MFSDCRRHRLRFDFFRNCKQQYPRARDHVQRLGASGRGEVMREPLQWYDHNADNPPWIKALAKVRRLAPREGWRYQHVQAIIVAIDQYAEATLGNREFFLNKPYGIGDRTKDNSP